MKYAILVVFVIFLGSCGKSRKEETKALAIGYEMKNFKLETSSNCKNDSISCAYYEITYPVFTNLDSTVLKKIQKQIDAAATMGNPDAEGKTSKQIGDEFIKDYTDFVSEMSGASGGKWYYESNAIVNVLTDTLISLSVNEEFYTGGAHGGANTTFINIHSKTGEAFTLKDFLKPGYENAITQAGERIFRQVRELPDTASFQYNYFEFPDNKFELNENYGFTKQGIVFFYNSYEIAPYAAGPTEVVIPYSELKDWLKK